MTQNQSAFSHSVCPFALFFHGGLGRLLFGCMNSARMGYESTQGSHGVSDARTTAAAGGLYYIDDYMQAMASMGRRIKEEGLIRWQRRAATTAAAPSNLQAMGCLVQESDPFKVHQLKK